MNLSAIILSWNSAHHLERCLETLFQSLNGYLKPFEVFIVDNGSKDNSREVIEKYKNLYPEELKPIFLSTNTGTTYSRNIAIKKAKGKYIAILDSDLIVEDEYTFIKLIKHLEENSKIGMVVPRLVYIDGSYQKSTDVFPTLMVKFRRYFYLKKMEKQIDIDCNVENVIVDYAISAFWLIKKEVVDVVGLLDENIFYAPEDVDYCIRLWKAGFKIKYIQSCIVIHNAQEISRGFVLNRALYEHVKGLLYYFIKHRYLIKAPRFK